MILKKYTLPLKLLELNKYSKKYILPLKLLELKFATNIENFLHAINIHHSNKQMHVSLRRRNRIQYSFYSLLCLYVNTVVLGMDDSSRLVLHLFVAPVC